MRIYRFYVISDNVQDIETLDEYGLLSQECITHGSVYASLYAWTVDPSKARAFRESRGFNIKMFDSKIKNEDYGDIKASCWDCELVNTKVKTTQSGRIVIKEMTIPKTEKFIIEHRERIKSCVFDLLSKYAVCELPPMKEKYEGALDILMYTTINMICCGDDESADYGSDAYSYGLTFGGHSVDDFIKSIDPIGLIRRLSEYTFVRGNA